MMDSSRPGTLLSPDASHRPINNPLSFNPTGTLKGRWNATVMNYDEAIRDMNSKWPLWLTLGIFFVIPGLIAMIVPFFTGKGTMSVVLFVGGLFLLSSYFGLLGFVQFWMRSPNTTRQTSVGLRNYRKEPILKALEEMMDSYGMKYSIDRRTSGPPKVYVLENGIKVKAEFTGSMLEPHGRFVIRYKLRNFEEALDLQIFLDDRMSKRKFILTKDQSIGK